MFAVETQHAASLQQTKNKKQKNGIIYSIRI